MTSRWTWRFLALPGVVWLSLFFIVAFYAVIAVAFGNQDSFSQPVPFWNPLDWNVGYVLDVLRGIWHGGQYLTVFLRTFAFVAIENVFDNKYDVGRLPTRMLGLPRAVRAGVQVIFP